MRRALATFAVGELHCAMLEIALPGFERYADEFGYELLIAAPRRLQRPPSWLKVARLIALLDSFDEVLWVDCDVVIVDASRDLADELSPDDWQALVRHSTPDGDVPNCGVWYTRRGLLPTLETVWSMEQYRDHVWWEQAALCELLGFGGLPVRLERPSELYARTCWLGLEWNSHEERDPHPAPRFAHATKGSPEWRLSTMHDHERTRQQAAEGIASYG